MNHSSERIAGQAFLVGLLGFAAAVHARTGAEPQFTRGGRQRGSAGVTYASGMLDLRRLQVFAAVAELGSLSAAAVKLSYTQPAVSRQIATLEQEVGARLLERGARGAQLTPAGELLLEHARVLLARAAATKQQLTALVRLEAGLLRLGSFAAANVWLLPAAVAGFSRSHPGVQLTLAGGDAAGATAALERGDLDLALVTDWDLPGGAWPQRIERLHLLDDELRVALPPGHPLAGRERVAVADLAAETWVEGARPDGLGPLERCARAAGFHARVGFVCDDWSGKQALVAAGAAVMLLPSLALPAARPELVVRRLEPTPCRGVYAAWPGAGWRPPARAAMLDQLGQAAAAHARQAAAHG